MPEEQEHELKFTVDERIQAKFSLIPDRGTAIDLLKKTFGWARFQIRPTTVESLRDEYFDTEDLKLYKAGGCLRVRHSGSDRYARGEDSDWRGQGGVHAHGALAVPVRLGVRRPGPVTVHRFGYAERPARSGWRAVFAVCHHREPAAVLLGRAGCRALPVGARYLHIHRSRHSRAQLVMLRGRTGSRNPGGQPETSIRPAAARVSPRRTHGSRAGVEVRAWSAFRQDAEGTSTGPLAVGVPRARPQHRGCRSRRSIPSERAAVPM